MNKVARTVVGVLMLVASAVIILEVSVWGGVVLAGLAGLVLPFSLYRYGSG